MFNSTILDVAIGMVFVYLLLSLICSAAHELGEYWLKKRASDLERGVRELLTTEDGADPGNLVEKIYNHGMVSGLFKGTYEASRIGSRLRHVIGTNLPSYIPSRNFALALMDLILPGKAAQPSGATNATPPPPPEVKLSNPPPPSLLPTQQGNPLYDLRNAVNSSDLLKENERVRTALISLIDAAGNDASKARENIEDWFNSGMDRVSGWYKRRSQIVIFVIALVVTIGMNADSVTIAKKLSTSKALRESLVAAADAYAKANATANPTSPPTPTQTPKQAPPPKASSSPNASPTPKATPTPRATPTPKTPPTPTPTATPKPEASSESTDACLAKSGWEKECKNNEDSPSCKLKKAQCSIQSLGLPLGWDNPDEPTSIWPGFHFWEGNVWSGWVGQIRLHFLGWLLTALAVSLGAPFWFDMLNKIIVVRSTVKPKEKSPDEKSKD
jgi:hypothetical protein